MIPGCHITVVVLKVAISVLGGARDTVFGLDTKSTSENPMVMSNLTYDTTGDQITFFTK